MSYDYQKLQIKILDYCKTEDVELVDKILLSCGTKISDRYIILNQELWDDCSCYYNVANVLEKVFHVDDVFGYVFCSMNDEDTDREELVSAMETNEIMDELGLNMEDYNFEED